MSATRRKEAEVSRLPERHEPRRDDRGLADLSARDYLAILVGATKKAVNDRVPDFAATLAYYGFLAIPSVLLITVGIFSLVASPDAVDTVLDKLGTVAPGEAVALLEDSLRRVVENDRGAWYLVLVGGAVALWTATSAISALIRALNVAYERVESRGFLKQRLVALAILALLIFAVALVVVLLVLGPVLSTWIGGLLGLETTFKWIWWTVQWPILVFGLLLAFAGILYLGPNVEERRWRMLTLGASVAVVLWLLVSGGFALYVSMFGSYNKTWGSIAAVIVMLTWLWLSSLALLFGAEVNAEARRSRELREGKPAGEELQAPAKA